jgi:tetratricopeptide (TPR) repeat protein
MEISRIRFIFILTGICLASQCCSNTSSDGSILPRWDSARSGEASTPRASASMQLTIEGHRLLESGRVDDAISVLERAVGLDPANGQNYYYLSDAWLRKGDIDQAEEFNRLAELYLKDNRKWRSRIKQQQEWIGEYKEERLHQ